jgi:hypothetical protein
MARGNFPTLNLLHTFNSHSTVKPKRRQEEKYWEHWSGINCTTNLLTVESPASQTWLQQSNQREDKKRSTRNTGAASVPQIAFTEVSKPKGNRAIICAVGSINIYHPPEKNIDSTPDFFFFLFF